MALQLVSEIEKTKIIGDSKLNITDLVDVIFNNFDQVLTDAEQVGGQMVNKLTNLKLDISKKLKRKRRDSGNSSEAIDSIKNQSSAIIDQSKTIVNITESFKLTELTDGLFTMINKVLDKITDKIISSQSLNNGAQQIQNEFANEFNKRDIKNDTEVSLPTNDTQTSTPKVENQTDKHVKNATDTEAEKV
jgi:hypothetical protein